MNKRMPTSVPAERIHQLVTLRDSIDKYGDDWKQLYHCTAWTRSTDDFVFLKSYNTIVAVYDKMDGVTYVFGRYSMTTYQHIRKFRNLMWEKFHTVDKPWMMPEKNLELVDWFA